MSRYTSLVAQGEGAVRQGLDAWVPGGVGESAAIAATGSLDVIQGTPGDDIINGSSADEYIIGETGSDRINAGDGDDLVSLALDPADFADGGQGHDELHLNFSPISDPIRISVSGGQVSLDGILVATGFESVLVWSSEGDDTLVGGNGWVGFSGGGGNDVLTFGDGGGWAYGEAGNDTLTAGAGDDLLDGGTGHDRITAGAGDDFVEFSDLTPDDFANGGEGFDYLEVDGNFNIYSTLPILITGGQVFVDGFLVATGFECFEFDAGLANDRLTGGSGWDWLGGGGGDDVMSTGQSGGSLFGDTGNDTLAGGSGLEDLTGGDGDDVLDTGEGGGWASGQAGDDILTDGSGIGELWGGAGNDSLDTGEGGGLAYGHWGNDTLIDGSGEGSLYGGDDDDVLDVGEGGGSAHGEAGDDTLWGGGGADILGGGTGTDRIAAGGGEDRVSLDDLDAGDFADGGEGFDDLWLDASAATAKVTVSDGQVFLGDLLVGIGFESFSDVWSGAGRDTLIGGTAGDRFYGGGGNDLLDAGEGDDLLWGEAGRDILLGGSGDDHLRGGKGGDELTGGAGADVFEFGLREGRRPVTDLVTDFEIGLDRLGLDGGLRIKSIERVRLDDGLERDTLVHLSNGNSIGLLGVRGVTADDLI